MDKYNYKKFKERIRMQQHIIDKQDSKIKELQDDKMVLYIENLKLTKEINNLKLRGLFARIFNK